MERAVITCNGTIVETYTFKDLCEKPATGLSLAHQVENFERELIIEALKKNMGSRSKTAAYLSTTERILKYKLAQYQINYRALSEQKL